MNIKQESIRAALIDGAIAVIAREGIDRATTKRIGTLTGINEVYIYRCFKGKEDLFVESFLLLDHEFVKEVMSRGGVMDREEVPFRERSKMFFDPVWRFVLNERDRSRCYIQYYHSPYFVKYSLKDRKERFKPLTDWLSDAFKPEADVWRLFNHVLDILFASAEQVFQGELPDDENTARYVFGLIYSSIEPYLAPSVHDRV